MVNEYWFAKYDPLLEFWNILYRIDDMAYQVSIANSKDAVDHIVQIHNKWYQDTVYDTYLDNITLSSVNTIIRQIAEENTQDAEYWTSQILTDVSQLPDAPHVLPF